ncbi:MAG: hypothetical protein M3Z08_09755, partial [Chloroflexota bacterium]|nr:hypothetical protein [Chloroflexota bacterium]
MPDIITVFNYPRTEEAYYNADGIPRFLTELAAQGYYLAGSDQGDVGQVWRRVLFGTYSRSGLSTEAAAQIDPESLFVPAVSSVLWHDVDAFLQHRSDELSIGVYSTARTGGLSSFNCTIDIAPHDGWIHVSMENLCADLSHYEPFLNILRMIYAAWHPIYGYQDDVSGGRPLISLVQARALDIEWLYDINLFSPELVAKLGRERVLTTPAWRVQALDDGGVLLVPALYYAGEPGRDYTFT